MAKLPLKIISEIDYTQPDVTKLLRPLNEFIRSVTGAFQRGLTIADNHVAMEVEVKLHTNAGAELPELPVQIKWDFPAIPPRYVEIGYIDAIDSDVEAVYSAVTPRWRYQNGYVVIRSLRGTFGASRAILVRFRIMA